MDRRCAALQVWQGSEGSEASGQAPQVWLGGACHCPAGTGPEWLASPRRDRCGSEWNGVADVACCGWVRSGRELQVWPEAEGTAGHVAARLRRQDKVRYGTARRGSAGIFSDPQEW